MTPPGLSYGLNLPNKKQPPTATAQKRKKTIFDDNDDDDAANVDSGEVEISSIGGLDDSSKTQSQPQKEHSPAEPPTKRKPLAMNSGKKPPLGTGKPGAKPLSKTSIFADDDDGDDTNENGNVQTEQLSGSGMSLGLNAPKSKSQKDQKTASDPTKSYTNLAALHSSKKYAEEAQSLDPSIYSYDAVYDTLHAPEKSKSQSKSDKSNEVPKYMKSLLHSAEIRKRDQLRAKDRMLAREREAEGDEFVDKEKFVTSAYKVQQEEMRRVEAEDAEKGRAEEERRRKNGGMGMVGFYRDVLARDEERHGEVLKASEEAAKKIQAGEQPEPTGNEEKREDDEARRVADLNARGAHIAVNDEGQVVDKRQLLSAGLNVAPKPKPTPSAAVHAPSVAIAGATGAGGRQRLDSARGGHRARQTEMIATQLEERAKREAEEEEARQKEVAEKNRSRKTEGEVSSAKERYLARKREREAAQSGK